MKDSTAAMQAEMDQGRALMLDALPPLYWGLYERLQQEGFSEPRAFELTRVYLQTTLAPGHVVDGDEE